MKSLVLSWLLGLGWASAQTQPVECTDESVYSHFIMRQQGSRVEMRHFFYRNDWLESAVDLRDPDALLVHYTQALFTAAFLQPVPHRVLMIGWGGGAVNRFFNRAYPEAILQTVELDSKAVALAEHYMDFQKTDHNRVAIEDGRRFLHQNRESWDWIILDAFEGDEIPAHLATREFYETVRRGLTPQGVGIVNLIAGSKLFEADVATLRASFPQVIFVGVPERNNVIALAVPYAAPEVTGILQARPLSELPPLVRARLPMEDYRQRVMKIDVSRALVLTDDYAPTEWLRTREISWVPPR